MQQVWKNLEGEIDPQRWDHVNQLLAVQESEAVWWRNACLLYFQTFSNRPFPAEIEQPTGDLNYYKRLQFPNAPGIRPSW